MVANYQTPLVEEDNEDDESRGWNQKMAARAKEGGRVQQEKPCEGHNLKI